MPLPINIGVSRVLIFLPPITAGGSPTSDIVNESAEMVFNENSEGLTGP